MARFGKILPEDIRDELVSTLYEMNLSQKALAREAHVSESFVSNLLNGNLPTRDPRRIASLARVILQHLSSGQINGMINPECHQNALKAVGDLQSQFGIVAARRSQGLPGDTMLSHYTNYIERGDIAYASMLLRGLPSTITLVHAPPQAGMSTFLRGVSDSARNIGYGAVFADCKRLKYKAKGQLDEPESPVVMKRLADLLCKRWNLRSADEPENPDYFNYWLETQIKDSAEARMLILENVTDLGKDTVEDLIGAFRQIPSRLNEGSVLYIAFGMNTRDRTTYQNVVDSAEGLTNNSIYIGWFTRNEVRELFKKLEPQPSCPSEKLFDKLWGQYRGQPFMTHFAAMKAITGSDPDAVYESAVRGVDDAYSHIRAVERLLGDEGDRQILKRIKNGDSNLPLKDARYLWDAHLIIHGNQRGTYEIASPFYKDLLTSLGV